MKTREERKNDLEVFNYIKDLNNKGIYLYLKDESISYKAKKDAMTREIIEDIKAKKEQIINFLKLKEQNSVSLSPLQLAYMAGQSKDQTLNKVNAHYYIEYTKDNIDISKLENALNTLINQNDALRLIILSTGEGLILKDLPKYKIQTYKMTSNNDKQNIRESVSHKIYPYDSWPMFSFIVGKSETLGDVLHFSFDCSILDAWCAGELIERLFKLYYGQEITQTKYSYKEYINGLENYKKKNKKILEKANQYWESRIATMSDAPNLAYKKNLKDLETTTFVRQEYTFDKDVLVLLEKSSKENKVTLPSILMTVYMMALSRISFTKNLTINITMFGKLPLNKDADKILGEFTNIGLIEYKNHCNLLAAIKNTQQQIFKLLEFRAYDGVNILNKVKKVDLKNGKIFPVVMTCMVGEKHMSVTNGFREEYSISQTPQVVIDHHVRIIDGNLHVTFDYIEELFQKSYIQKLISLYKEYINVACKNNMGGVENEQSN
ncbi:TPA: hypothetical protein LLB96_000078 [Enterococcus faecium]|nr:hypothetical protein [Enterococcus faecium]